MICPECNKDNTVFCGVAEHEGRFVNVWECLNEDCEHEWFTEINTEQKKDFNG